MSNDRGTVRVLMVVENNSFPQDPRVRREAAALAAAGHTLMVIAPKSPGQSSHETAESIDVYRYPAPPDAHGLVGYLFEYGYSTAVIFLLCLYLLLRRGFDVIHTANPPDTMIVALLPFKLLGKKIVFDHHDLSPEMYEAKHHGQGRAVICAALRVLERLSCQFANLVIATNESYKELDMERNGVPEHRIAVVRNGPELKSRENVRTLPQLNRDGRMVIGYGGVMGVQDGVDYLLRALHHLRYDLGRDNFHCVLIGGEPESLARLQPMAQRLGLEDHTSFISRVAVEQYLQYIASIEIGIEPAPKNPYTDRSTMLKLMDYMSFSKPIVCFDLREHRVTAGGAALYVQPNDEKLMAAAIATLMDSPELRERMGAIGLHRLQTELAWEFSVRNLVQAYSRFARSRRSRRAALNVGGMWRHWAKRRSLIYLLQRFLLIRSRYGLRPDSAEARTLRAVRGLTERGCSPTLAVPGRVVAKYGPFCREIQSMGAELAIHSFDHVDFGGLSDGQRKRQLMQASEAFVMQGIRINGVRCPYLSANTKVLDNLPQRHLYSSNEPVTWMDALPTHAVPPASAIYRTLERFYSGTSSEEKISLPYLRDGQLEIPVSVPDDLQLIDGLHYTAEQIAGFWIKVLDVTHARGELFVLLFHPESFAQCEPALEALLTRTAEYRPSVWIACLADISRWWREKCEYEILVRRDQDGFVVDVKASGRVTLLARNLPNAGGAARHGRYSDVNAREFRTGPRLPFVGVSDAVPPSKIALLRNMGYVVAQGSRAELCDTYVSGSLTDSLDERALVAHLEESNSPLLRFGNWPDRHKCALAVTGDLDALSLGDYVARLLFR
jgi:glycosyltransferase involved in cell wall biosynthesis/peptidoglycan/xylan/chitin deacetylase (PgdA/CDA1 family)